MEYSAPPEEGAHVPVDLLVYVTLLMEYSAPPEEGAHVPVELLVYVTLLAS
jgi:hypothetical protein